MPLRWYFDFISPFAYLQWPRIRQLAAEREVALRPLLFAGLLQRHGHKGPAEIPGKREFTYRFVLWRARQLGRPLRFPPAHPFNPLPALRLCVAAGSTPQVVEAIFNHLWGEGRRGDDLESLRSLAAELGIDTPDSALADPAVKRGLHENFEAAVVDGVFGVPTLVAGDQLFWGEDSSAMLDQYLADPAGFEDAEMRRVSTLPVGIQRR